MRFAAVLLLATSLRADIIAEGMERLYNFDFPKAHASFARYSAQHSADPLGPAFEAATHLFFELDRLRILQSDFFGSDKQISSKKKLQPDPDVRTKFFSALDKSQALAQARLDVDPDDADALFAFSMTEGLRTDYMAFVEKKQLSSLSNAKKAHNYCVRLLRKHPNYVDAYISRGITEYLVGSLPFFVRWFVRFEDTEGSKEAAVEDLTKVAKDGRYMGPFAKILLSVVHYREKRFLQAEQLLADLVVRFPENRVLKEELTKLRSRQKLQGR